MTPVAMNNSNHDSSDHTAGSFITGAIVGALVALSLGTEEGRRISGNLINVLKGLSKDIGKEVKKTPQFQQIENKVTDYQQEFRKSVTELNSNIQNTGRQVIDRLHRMDSPDFFQKDGKTLS